VIINDASLHKQIHRLQRFRGDHFRGAYCFTSVTTIQYCHPQRMSHLFEMIVLVMR
jgi:hypothetical protein